MTDSVNLPNDNQSAPAENIQPQSQQPSPQPENAPAPQPEYTEPQPAPEPVIEPAAVPENIETPAAVQDAVDNAPQTPAVETPVEQPVAQPQTAEQPQNVQPQPVAEDEISHEDSNGEMAALENGHEYHEHSGDDYDHQKESQAPEGNTLVVRYGVMQFVGEFRHNFPVVPTVGSKVVVRTDRGVELGEVLMPVFRNEEGCSACVRKINGDHLQKYLDECGPEHPFRRQGKVLRTANQQDLIDFRHLSHSADEAAKFCRENIAKYKLNMKLVKVEHLLGGGRIIFYFTAEQRVDFRDLVKTLASQFRTRIEMRQVGSRDEARLVADFERCGQRCCCQQFLKNLKPVSMKMAKIQKATLDPSKISGRCGRLMCCLRYEDEGYEELRKRLPRRGIWVRLEDGTIGRVVDTQILTQLVKLELPNREFEAVNVDDIVERDIPQPSEQELEVLAQKPRESKPVTPVVAPVTYFSAQTMMEIDAELDEKDQVQADASSNEKSSSEEDGENRSSSRRRRHKKNRRPGGDRNRPEGQDQDGHRQFQPRPESGGEQQQRDGQQRSSKHKRRHRRHSRRPQDGGGQSGQPQGTPGGE